LGNYNFWQKWLLFVGMYLVGFGLYLAFFSQSGLVDYIFNRNIDSNFWIDSELSENVK
jgi:hypothetical protein